MISQAGAFVDPLPATSRNMELVGKLGLKTPDEYKFDPVTGQPDTSEPDLVAGQIADVSVFKGFAYLASWSEPSCKRGGFFVVDIRNPANPVQTGFVQALTAKLPRRGHARDHDQDAGVLAATCWPSTTRVRMPATGAKSGGFDLYDVTNPRQPAAADPGLR